MIIDREVLPCGCKNAVVLGEFWWWPCYDPDCEYYLFAQQETRRQGKPIRFQAATT